MSIKSMVGKKCGRCGLRLKTHTDAKCSEIVRLERDELLGTLLGVSELLGGANLSILKTLRFIKEHKAHEALKNDPFYR